MLILAIETSCDETSVALFGDVVRQVIRSQIGCIDLMVVWFQRSPS